MSGYNDDSGRTDPLARLLFEPPTLVTDSLDFLLLVGVLPVLGHNPPSYLASQRPDLKEWARTRCLDREPQSKIIDSKLTRYLSYLHGEGRVSIGDLHDHFATRYHSHNEFGPRSARQLNDFLLEQGLRPIHHSYYLWGVNKEYFPEAPRYSR